MNRYSLAMAMCRAAKPALLKLKLIAVMADVAALSSPTVTCDQSVGIIMSLPSSPSAEINENRVATDPSRTFGY